MSAVPYLIYSGSGKLRGNVERGLESVLSSQEPCGYIGNYPDDGRVADDALPDIGCYECDEKPQGLLLIVW